ncbi:hypothetical protein [Pedobacter sp. B4-66]|uniref:hypothetical protein n=1 Tax=Pedobacter sp. B4-66 TaxID=2817280 RepID=UPI001BDA9BBB|nr:hypothetical protein [Pedobacter sp. B4-66]
MKHLFALSIVLCLFINVRAQQPTSTLSGTWEIKNFIYGNNPNNNEQNTKFKKYKSFTPTHFTVIEVDPKTNITTTSIFGTYTIVSGVYTEKILNVNRESSVMIGQTFSFTIAFEGDDKMIQTGAFNGMKTSELWVRVKATDGSIEQTQKKTPLFVINTPGIKIPLKIDSAMGSPFKTILQDQISSIEVIKNETAIQLYGEKAKDGVVIITIKEQDLDKVLKKLKEDHIIE